MAQEKFLPIIMTSRLLSTLPIQNGQQIASVVDGERGLYIDVNNDRKMITGMGTSVTTEGIFQSSFETNTKGRQSTTLTVGFTPDCDFNIKNYIGVDYSSSAQLIIVLAIAKLPESGGKIILREGIYNILDPIYLNKENITIEGMGNSTVLRRMADFPNGIFIVTANYCEITRCKIDGNKDRYTGATYQGVSINASNIILLNNKCVNTYNGIYLSNSNHIILNGNRCYDNLNVGIILDNTTNCSLIANDFKNNTYYGLALYNATENNNVIGNIFDQNLSHGMYLTDSNNNTFIGNSFNKNSVYGIYNLNSNNNTYIGNSFNKNVSGIRINGSTSITISGNTVKDNSNKGIDIYNSSYCGITGNTLNGNTNYSIDVSGNRNNISSNTMYQTTGYACINISSGEKNMVTDNIVYNRGVVDSGTGTILDNNNPL